MPEKAQLDGAEAVTCFQCAFLLQPLEEVAMIEVPPAASNHMASVVVVVSKGGNPAASPNRKTRRTDWSDCRVPSALHRAVF